MDISQLRGLASLPAQQGQPWWRGRCQARAPEGQRWSHVGLMGRGIGTGSGVTWAEAAGWEEWLESGQGLQRVGGLRGHGDFPGSHRVGKVSSMLEIPHPVPPLPPGRAAEVWAGVQRPLLPAQHAVKSWRN